MSNEKILSLCKKLNALAKQGVGGEKTNAAEKLYKLMEKNGISFEDIEDEVLKPFNFKPKNRTLFVQVVATVIGGGKVYKMGRKPGVFIDVTAAQFLEIESKYSFYQTQYNKELKTLATAFVIKNQLFPIDGKGGKELTQKQREEYYAAMKMAEGIERSHFRKQINN